MAPVVLGALVGLGLLLVRRGLFPPPVQLPVALARLTRQGRSVAEVAADAWTRSSMVRRVASSVGGRLGHRVESDLAVLERTPERFALQKLSSALAMAGLCLAVAGLIAVGGRPVPFGHLVVVVVCAVAAGFVAPDVAVRRRAADRRSAFRHALSSYLDLVNVLLSGGAGVEGALHGAADAGDGWAFMEIRRALVRAHTVRSSPWDCFGELGRRLQVDELSEIAASIKLAGEQGARVRLSLAARAASLRGRQMAEVEAEAQSATERMGLPMVLMFIGFIALLAYPALQRIVTTL